MDLRWLAGALAALVTAGCGGDAEPAPTAPLEIPEGCNPIAFEHDCLLPYPSDVFVVDDPSLPSGRRVALPEPAWLVTNKGKGIDPHALYPEDGFSPGSQLLATFAQAIADEPLVGWADDYADSLGDQSPTVLLDPDSGERVPHFAEVDPRATDDAQRALVIRPLVRLAEEKRYVVAIRGLTDPAGEPVAAPRGFARLRDGTAQHERLTALSSHYDEAIFAPLEAAGVPRSELQLAWDFTVRSRQNIAGDMIEIRAQTLAALQTEPLAVSVVSAEDDPDEHTARRIEATVEVPRFIEANEPMAPLLRDEEGEVMQDGTFEVPFTIWIPNSVADLGPSDPPARLMQFGHGFFGGRHEVDGFINELADERGFVVVAADWWGMTEADRIPLTDALVANTAEALRTTDRVHQAMANFIVLAAARSTIVDLPEVAELGPSPTFATEEIYFYGISQGHILGGTYLSLSPAIERGALGVGGANFSLIMFRARPFLAFLAILNAVVSSKLDQQKFAVLAQATFDRVDPLSYAPLFLDDPLAGSPAERHLLMHHGIGDAQVPGVSAHLHARSLGLSLLEPTPREVFALPGVEAPFDGSALVEFDFGTDPLPEAQAIPPTEDTEAHEGVRRLDAAKEQLDRFLRPGGVIEQTCDGPCDPE